MKKGSAGDVDIFLPASLVERFARHPNFTDITMLYLFYYRMAIRQKTNQPRATDKYCISGLSMGRAKFYAAKKALQKMKIIEKVEVGRTSSKFGEPYIRLLTYKGRDWGTDKRKTQEECGIDNDQSYGEFPQASILQRSARISTPVNPQEDCEYDDDIDNADDTSLDRSARISTPLEECGDDDDLDHRGDPADVQNTAECSKPECSNKHSNAYKKISDLRNASGASLKPPQAIPIKEVKRVKICPFGHTYHVDYFKFEECERLCSFHSDCDYDQPYSEYETGTP